MRLFAVLAAAAVIALPASATVLFSQNFNTVTTGNNKTSIAGFTISGGVDVLNSGTNGVTCAGGVGRCVDLVGSPLVGAITSVPIVFQGNSLITVTFAVSGNQRINTSDVFNFALTFTNPETISQFTQISGFQGTYGGTGANLTGFGTYSETIARTRTFVQYALSFVPTSGGSMNLVFGAGGTVIPEPNTWAMLVAGFGFVGLASRRRRSVKTA
jgi:hypothetical protein